jgi:hypothetical protein
MDGGPGQPSHDRLAMNPVAVVQEPAPGDLAGVLDHGVGRPDIETHDLLEPARERSI